MPLPRGHAPRRRALTAVGLVLAVTVLTACSGSPAPDEGATRDQDAAATADPGSGELDVSEVPVPRGDLCPVLPEDGVVEALGGEVVRTDHYLNGDEVEVRPGYTDVVHEYGCVYEAADGSTARVWVFARPVDTAEAQALVRRARRGRRGRDCAFPDSIAFGTPSLTSVCEVRSTAAGTTDATAPTVRARLEGLFGDTWVGCEVAEPLSSEPLSAGPSGEESSAPPRADVVQRAEQWCTEVIVAVGAD